MKCRKNWLYDISVLLAVALFLYAFATCFTGATDAANPEWSKGILVIGLFGGVVLVCLLCRLYVRFDLERIFSADEKWMQILELIAVIIVLGVAAWMRVDLVRNTEYVLNEQENRYYEIANHLEQGTLRTESVEYCDHIARNPHDIGYAVMLKSAFSVGGVSVESGLYLNVILAVTSMFFLYTIGRKLSGRCAALLVLAWSAFMPFEMHKVLSLTEEPATRFLFLACSALFVHTLVDFDKIDGRPGSCFAWNIVLGVLLAIGAVVNPVFILVGIIMLIVVTPQKMGLPNKPKNDLPLLLRAIHHGWIRGLLIALPFLLLYGILFSNIEMAVNRDVSAMNSFVKTIGTALAQLKGDFVGSFSLVMQEFEQAWNISGFQGTMTAVLLFAGLVGLVSLYRREGSFHQYFVILFWGISFCGTFVLGEQNPCVYLDFCCLLLAGHGVQSFFEEAEENRIIRSGEDVLDARHKAARRHELEAYKKVEEEVTKIREEALANVFDMNYALEHGHVIMTVSEAYGKEKNKNVEEVSAESEN